MWRWGRVLASCGKSEEIASKMGIQKDGAPSCQVPRREGKKKRPRVSKKWAGLPYVTIGTRNLWPGQRDPGVTSSPPPSVKPRMRSSSAAGGLLVCCEFLKGRLTLSYNLSSPGLVGVGTIFACFLCQIPPLPPHQRKKKRRVVRGTVAHTRHVNQSIGGGGGRCVAGHRAQSIWRLRTRPRGSV